MESGIHNNRSTASPEDKPSLEDEKQVFGVALAHLDSQFVKENDSDCFIFSWVTPSLELSLKQSCIEVIPLQ